MRSIQDVAPEPFLGKCFLSYLRRKVLLCIVIWFLLSEKAGERRWLVRINSTGKFSIIFFFPPLLGVDPRVSTACTIGALGLGHGVLPGG